MFGKIVNRLSEYKLYWLLFALIICFTFITDFNGLYGQDSYEYLRFTNALIEFAKHGIDPGKSYWPVMYQFFGAILSIVFKTEFGLQLVSIISLLLSGVYLEKILKALYKNEAQIARWFVFVFFLFSPYPLRSSITIMSDSLCLFFITASSYYFIKYAEEKRDKIFVAFIVCATAAICTRYVALVVIVIPAIFVMYYFAKRFNFKVYMLAGVGIVLVLMPYILIHKDTPLDFLHHELLQGWSFKNIFMSNFDTADGHASHTFPNIAYCLFNLVHPAFCFAGILFLIVGIKSIRNKSDSSVQWIFVASLLLYALFLAGIPFQNLRFLILSFPFVLILFFPAFSKIYHFLKKAKPMLIIPILILCLVIQSGLFARVFIPFYHDNKTEKKISNEVIKQAPATLYTFSIDAAVRYYGFKGKIVNMWEVKLDTLPITIEKAQVLFNQKQFKDVWMNKNPMLNWEYLKTKYQLIKVEDLPDDWELYSIKNNP